MLKRTPTSKPRSAESTSEWTTLTSASSICTALRTKISPCKTLMYHRKTAWLLVTLAASQLRAMARPTADEMKWRTGRSTTACFCRMIRKTHQLFLTTLYFDIYLRPGPCNWRPVPNNQPEGTQEVGRQRPQTSTTGSQLAYYRPSNPKTFPRWNYKKADWEIFSRLTYEYCKTVKADHFNINKATESFKQSILRDPATIPRGARKNCRPYWTEERQELEDEVARTREKVENNPTLQNKTDHRACTAKYRKAYMQAARANWREQTEKLNLNRDGNKLWKLIKAMNDETRSSPVMSQRDQETVTGKSTANCFINSYEQVSNIMIPNNRKQQVHDEIKNHQADQDPPEHRLPI